MSQPDPRRGARFVGPAGLDGNRAAGVVLGGPRPKGNVRRLVLLLVLPAILIVVGTTGYMLLERTDFLTALYMTVITLTTVGYGEFPNPLSASGRVFTIFLLLGGVFTLFWAASEMIRAIVSGEMQGAFGRRRMERILTEMQDHLIVCGYGRMGRRVCKEFSLQKLPFVLIDRSAETLGSFDLPYGIALQGDATFDETLKKAGVERARALVTVAGSDSDNLYITMSARLLNEEVFIVSRAEDEPAQQKLLRAGANRVVSPFAIGGMRVADAVLRPTVVDFLDLATRAEYYELQIDETRLTAASPLIGQTIKDSMIHKQYGIFVVAIKKETGQMVYNPPGDTVLDVGDTLISLGHRDNLEQLDRLARG